jgi:hypothetical protein
MLMELFFKIINFYVWIFMLGKALLRVGKFLEVN